MDVIKHIKEVFSEETAVSDTLPTGYSSIDSLILGVRKKELSLFASTPGIGKSAFLLNLALNMAKAEKSVLFITYETTARKISEKLLGIMTGMDPNAIEKDSIPEGKKNEVYEGQVKLGNLPIYISEQFMFRKEMIRGEIEYIKKANISAIFIDSLQFVQYSSLKDPKERDIENVMLLKNFARENDVSLLVSTQIRSKDIPQGKTPSLSDMGGEEELADMVFILNRPYAYSMEQYVGETEEFVVQLAKNRNGPSGVFKLMFSRRNLKIEEGRLNMY